MKERYKIIEKLGNSNSNEISVGSRVKFIGCSLEQQRWGSNTPVKGKLVNGRKYIISDIEKHTWHTKVSLDGIDGKFNSVCFELV